jgi:predicted component of type VI protein secretion system
MRLSIQIEFDKTLDLETDKTTVIVGRSPKSDLVIPSDGISRSHCKIEYTKDKQFFITDLDSANGVSLNGERLLPMARTMVPRGSMIMLGNLLCELSSRQASITDVTKIVSSTKEASESGEYTSTIRVGRIDLVQPSITLELEKKPVSKRPRNPVLERPKTSPDTRHLFWKRVILFMLALAVAGTILFFIPGK